jgi:hypothetical protein
MRCSRRRPSGRYRRTSRWPEPRGPSRSSSRGEAYAGCAAGAIARTRRGASWVVEQADPLTEQHRRDVQVDLSISPRARGAVGRSWARTPRRFLPSAAYGPIRTVAAKSQLHGSLLDPIENLVGVRHKPRAPDMISGVASPPAGASDDLTRELLWRAADRASNWALQGQVTVQSRFGNFLLADSFLLLSWATVYSDGSKTTSRTVVLAVLAMTSVLLGAGFALLGSRYAKYDRLQWDLAAEAEGRLPAVDDVVPASLS